LKVAVTTNSVWNLVNLTTDNVENAKVTEFLTQVASELSSEIGKIVVYP